MNAQLAASILREKQLLHEKSQLLQRQATLAQEFEHRLVNSFQVIASLLLLQSRAARTTEAATQLTIAARRVAAVERVHRQLHLLDHQRNVHFKQYLDGLCADLSALLFPDQPVRTIIVGGAEITLSTSLGIPLGFIVSELITNASKYSTGNVSVQVGRSATACSLTVSDEGPGLPVDFSATGNKGLGMKIIRSLVKQIGGNLQFAPGSDGRGTQVKVTFTSQPQSAPKPCNQGFARAAH